MRHFSWLLTLPLTIVVVVFALANRTFVEIDLWPFNPVSIPVFVLVLGSLLIGFLFGALIMWLSSGKQRRRARAQRGQIAKLERQTKELERAQPRAEAPPATTLPVAAPNGPPAIRQQGEPGRPAA